MANDLAQQASSKVRDIASWLESREPGDLLEEARRFARRRPGTFLACAALAGLVGGRFTRGMADEARDDSGTADTPVLRRTEPPSRPSWPHLRSRPRPRSSARPPSPAPARLRHRPGHRDRAGQPRHPVPDGRIRPMTSVPNSWGSHAVGDTGGRHGSIADAIPPAEQVEGAHQTFDKGEVSSLGAIVSDISNDLSTLMRQEVALAKAEATETATRAGKGAGMLGGAGVAGHMALLFLSIALMWGLAELLDSLGWASVIVALLWAVIAAVLAVIGRRQLKKAPGHGPHGRHRQASA